MQKNDITYLLNKVSPLVFKEDQSIYRKFMEENVVHKRGLLVVAPSGTGKTYFVTNQKENHWIDGDHLWIAGGAHPNRAWWTEGIDVINEVQQRSDIISSYAKKLGLWIIGADCYWLVPDAIVIPDWKIHQQHIIEREKYHYDGGAKSKDFEQVLGHREYLLSLAEKKNIPVFETVSDMDSYFQNK